VIKLHTLGDAVITVGDREVRPTSPTVFAALLYLGVERGQRVPRAALQELLFPEASERSGAHSLRQLLYKLRQLGAPVQAEGDVVSLPADAVSDDYSGNGNGNGAHTRANFLAVYVPRISEAFDDWLERKRSQVGSGLRRSLAAQMSARRDAADWAGVERIAREILSADEFNEEATLALAEATALSGSKSEAVRILERYESETGRSDLKLNAAILRRRISERLPEGRRRPLDTPFVGREPEAEALRDAVRHLRSGTGGTVVIVGEPGIGKTRLLEEASALAALEGVNVKVVRCQPHYGSRPMGVFIELVPALLQSRGALGVAPEMLEHLTLLTSHRDDRANRPADARDDSTRSGILLAAVRDLVDAVSGEAPLLVAVEDAHWADPTSLTELSALVSGSRGRQLLVMYTTRQLEPLTKAGVVSDATPVLRLKPLADTPMRELSGHLLPSLGTNSAGADVAEWCAQTAAGNPFYLQVLCAHYEDTRQQFGVPPSMRSALTRRIELLPKDCRRLLDLAAMLGVHACVETLKDLSELRGAAFLGAIQRLEEDGYLRTRADAALVAHDLLRECTLELIPPLTKGVLHGQVAETLEANYDSTHDAALLWDCASHWAASGQSPKALRFVLRCARHTADIGRASEAAQILQFGYQYASTTDAKSLVLSERASALRAAGHPSEMLEALQQRNRLHGGHQTEEARWETELRMIEARWAMNYSDEGAVARLEVCASTNVKPSLRVEAALMLVRIAFERHDPRLAQSAFDAVSMLLDAYSFEYANRMLPLVYQVSFGDMESGLTIARSFKADLGNFANSDRFRAARNIGMALNNLAESHESFAISRDYYNQASSLGLRHWQFDFAANCVCSLSNVGDFGEANNWFDLAKSLGTAGGATIVDLSFHLSGVELAINAGDINRARSLLNPLLERSIASAPRVQAFVRAYSVAVAQLNQDYTSSDEELSGLLSDYERMKTAIGADILAMAVCEALRRRGWQQQRASIVEDYLTRSRRGRGSRELPSFLGGRK
jgi:DNA-binding SARP family transcriptional activator